MDLDYRLVLDAFADAVIESDAGGRITYVNAAVERLLGWSKADLVGSPLTRIMPASLRAAHEAGFQRFVTTRQPKIIGKPIRFPALHRDGSEADVELTLSAFRCTDGSDLFIALFRDLADRVELERQIGTQRLLRCQHDAMRVMAEARALDDAVPALLAAIGQSLQWDAGLFWAVDSDAQTLRTHSVWARTTVGFGAFLEASRAVAFAPGEGPPGQVWQTLRPAWRPDIVEDPRYQRARIAGEVGFHSALLFPVAFANQTHGVLEFLTHEAEEPKVELLQTLATLGFQIGQFIERLEQERHLAKRLQELKAAIATRDEFLSIASHEFRTPLTTIDLQLEGLQRALRSGMDGERRDNLGRKVEAAIRQTDRLMNLIEGLLDVSRIGRGRFRLELEEFDMADLIREVGERFAVEAARTSCVLTVSGLSSLRGRWDRARIDQALTNLLANALKYGSGKPINLSLEAESDAVNLVVHDHGIGIGSEDLKRIFEPFERAVPFKHYGGLGLGLYLTRQIAEGHGGSITVRSVAGDGATFTVRLPRYAEQKPWPSRESAGNLTPTSRRWHILVVENDRDLRESIMEALEDEGYSVAEASDGLRALEYLRTSTQMPSLILLDLMMPNMNGFQFRKEQLKSVKHAAIPVAVLTADSNAKGKTASVSAAGFLRKPLKIAALLELVVRLLSSHALEGGMP